MSLQATLVLPEDVVLIPIEDVAEDQRQNLDWSPGDYAISRPRVRASAKLVDPDSAELLQEFRQPSRVAEAVLRFATRRELPPAQVLNDAYPLLQRLVGEKLLVDADGDDTKAKRASLEVGAEFDGVRVTQVLQVLPDTELYQARAPDGRLCVLKVLREDTGEAGHALQREGAVLRRLQGRIAPELDRDGLDQDPRFLRMEWCPGHDVATVAAGLRERPAGERARRLRDLAVQITRAYAELHEHGVVHGDVHPRNVLVDHGGRVRLLDYGLAHDLEARPEAPPPRGGVPFFFEPEFARASRERRAPPPATPASDQYSAAVLLDQLFAGAWYLDFSLERQESLRQIAEDPPLGFAARGAAPWPAVEAALRRALDKDPSRRFASMRELAAALAAAPLPPSPPRGATPDRGASLEGLVARLHPDGALFRDGFHEAPTGSIANGMAGFAYALLRVAVVRDDPELLSHADLWSMRALAEATPDSFSMDELNAMFEREGRAAPFHGWAGLDVVQAKVARAMGNVMGAVESVGSYLRRTAEPTGSLDLLFGRLGVLHGHTELLAVAETRDAVREAAAPLLAGILAEMDSLPPIVEARELSLLGLAHGWAGIVWTLLRWCRVSGEPVPESVRVRLEQLAELAEHSGNGLRWRRKLFEHDGSNMPDHMTGWCNGSAGHALLWTEAARHWPDQGHGERAVGAARHAVDDPAAFADLCCGLTGRAYAALVVHQWSGEREWLDEARHLADRAVRHLPANATREHGLFKGNEGLICLLADLEQPEFASVPWFETL